jgi:hypothetical protein
MIFAPGNKSKSNDFMMSQGGVCDGASTLVLMSDNPSYPYFCQQLWFAEFY